MKEHEELVRTLALISAKRAKQEILPTIVTQWEKARAALIDYVGAFAPIFKSIGEELERIGLINND